MQKKYLYGLALCSLLSIGSLGSVSSAKIFVPELNIDKNVVVYTGDDVLFIREEPNLGSKKLGVLTLNQSAILTGKKDESGEFLEIKSGEFNGWVRNTENLIKGKELLKRVTKNIKDYDVEVVAKKPTGIYSHTTDMYGDKFSYSSKATIAKTDDEIKLYKTPELKDTIDGLSYLEEYVRVTTNGAYLKYKDINMDIVDAGAEFKIIEENKNSYVVFDDREDLNLTISKKDCEVFDKEVKVSNLIPLNFKYNTMYNYEIIDENIAKLFIGDKECYIDRKYLYITYFAGKDSLAVSIANPQLSYRYKGVPKRKGFYKLSLSNDISDTSVSAYVNSDDCDLVVDFDDAEAYVEPESPVNYSDNSSNPSISYNDYEHLLSDSFIKDAYHYDFDETTTTPARAGIINFALKWLGHPYVWGGTSLANGCDCSGFCMQVLHTFGFNITRTTRTQVADSYGKKIRLKDIQPGDLIYYTKNGYSPYHVVMYLGGDRCVNASCKKYGICVSKVKFDKILCIKNYID